MQIPKGFEKVRDVKVSPEELRDFETEIRNDYEAGKIKGPIHLSSNNEEEIIEIFSYVDKNDWVFSAWRNHYHAICHGVDKEKLRKGITSGHSMGTNNVDPNFYASSIVGGIVPLALGAALAIKRKKLPHNVWCFIGDMTFESGVFHECYKYAKNFDLPLRWVIEDNELSVNTPTIMAWGTSQKIPEDVVYYKYKSDYPHHGTGKWVNF
jgi:TPP-dependent pyruvate/acetoin dehydrogenase alpha subunit